MKHMAIQYFQNLHTNDPGVEPSGVLEFVVPPIDEDTNFDLCKGFSDEEIADAMFQIRPLKAPGLNGFSAWFYQQNWMF
jgi:hypothetical protein